MDFKPLLFGAIFLIVSSNLIAQKASYTPFSVIEEAHKLKNELTGTQLQIDDLFIAQIHADSPAEFELLIPNPSGKDFVLQLEKKNILADNFRLIDQFGNEKNYQNSLHYTGRFANGTGMASISIFKDRMSGMLSLPNEGNLHLAQEENKRYSNEYLVYNDNDWLLENPFTCYTSDEGIDLEIKEEQLLNKQVDQCVKVFLEADFHMFQDFGSSQAVMDYLAEVWVPVAALYEVETITLNISEIMVWESLDPYSNVDGGLALEQFQGERTTYNGDIAHLVTTNPNNTGGIAFIDVLCTDFAYGYSNITANYSDLPVYSWTVNVLAHEIGHNLGSPHTHSCEWPMGPLDNCATPEGSCSPGQTPINGGTIMSYCHLTTIGIDFDNGFGTLPGNLIQSTVAAASCLEICDSSSGGLDADFNFSYVDPCVVGAVLFENLSIGNPTTYSWAFEEGTPSSSSSASPLIQYGASGNYSVTLTISDGVNSDTKVMDQVVEILNNPVVTPTAEIQNGGATVLFDVEGTDADTYLWNFGDGSTASTKNPSYTYASPGTYNISLQVSNVCGNSFNTLMVTIDGTPQPEFIVNETSGCVPFQVSFLNQSTNGATSFNWEFEGAIPSSSTAFNPQVTYSQAGDFDVSLTVSNSSGSNTIVKENFIHVDGLPQVDFNFVVGGAAVSFMNNSDDFNDLFWDFGDGNSSTDFNPSYVYQGDGVYQVTLTASNECGIDTYVDFVTISAGPVPGFSGSSFGGCVPVTISYANLSTNSTTVMWQFPGGFPSVSTQQNPIVSYNEPGVYDVKMTIGGSMGSAQKTFEDIIIINDDPVSGFSYENDGVDFQFLNETLYAEDYFWTFGDGGTSSEENPIHVYDDEGFYNVLLIVNGECGTDETEMEINAYSLPTGTISLNNTNICEGETVNFETNFSDNVFEYDWSITGPENKSSSNEDPNFTLNQPGVYSVELNLTNPAGSETIVLEDYITVGVNPLAQFNFEVNVFLVDFFSQGTIGNNLMWDFGDGGTSTSQNPDHFYSSAGTYTVTLSSTNECGTDQTTQTITVNEIVSAGFTSDVQEICGSGGVQFENLSSDNSTVVQWFFEGGSPMISTSENPLIQYNSPGEFDVTLQVSNGVTVETVVLEDYVRVDSDELFEVNFSNISTTIIKFNDFETPGGTYLWDWGDGTQSTVGSPVHNFMEEGTYEVSLDYSNSCILWDTSFTMLLYSRPQVEFIFDSSEECAPIQLTMDNQSSSNVTEWEWIAEGSLEGTSSEKNPTFSYFDAGNFDLTLIAKNPLFEETMVVQEAVKLLTVPIADFNANANGVNLNLTNTSEWSDDFTWSFGDGQNTSTNSPSHTYQTEGTYTVTLQANNQCGSDEKEIEVLAYSRPQANFSINTTRGCAPFLAPFQNTSSDNITELRWEFEGGNPATSNAQLPQVSYTERGEYDVKLIVSNPLFSDSIVFENYIIVDDVPESGWDYQQQGLNFQFYDLSMDADQLFWDFGDGTTSSEVNPVHVYAMEGNYYVHLTASNECGSQVYTELITPSLVPSANFSVDKLAGCIGIPFQFYNLSDDLATSLLWTFEGADLTTSVVQDPLVIYSIPGTYDVTLVAFSEFGADTTKFENYIEVQTPPQPNFTFGFAGNVVNTVNLTTTDGDYLWVAGDLTSMEESPQFTFDSNGDFPISLIAFNACGADTITQNVTVTALPEIQLELPEKICINTFTPFMSLSTNVDSFEWYINDVLVPGVSTSDLTWAFSELGIYDLKIVGINQWGETVLDFENAFEVVSNPVAGFAFEFFNDQVLFTDLSQDAINVFWDFGDGETSSSSGDQFHLYEEAGFYEVSQIVVNDCGTDTLKTTINADILLPQVLFFSNHELCVPTQLNISEQSAGSPNLWFWELRGPVTLSSTDQEPDWTLTQPGTYDLYVEMSNEFGGVSEFFEAYVFVQGSPTAQIEYELSDLGRLTFNSPDTLSTSISWDFGDGNMDTNQSGSYQYSESGSYELNLQVENICGNAERTITIEVEQAFQYGEERVDKIIFKPNPTDESTQVELAGSIEGPYEVEILDAIGRKLYTISRENLQGEDSFELTDIQNLPQGIYLIAIKTDDYLKSAKLLKIKK